MYTFHIFWCRKDWVHCTARGWLSVFTRLPCRTCIPSVSLHAVHQTFRGTFLFTRTVSLLCYKCILNHWLEWDKCVLTNFGTLTTTGSGLTHLFHRRTSPQLLTVDCISRLSGPVRSTQRHRITLSFFIHKTIRPTLFQKFTATSIVEIGGTSETVE